MDIKMIANLISFPVGVVCLSISIRAFFLYTKSRSDMIFILGLAMASIACGIFAGNIGEAHLRLFHYNTEWARFVGSSSGALFIFLSSLVKSYSQLQRLRRWQVVFALLFLVVVFLTPLLPPFASPLIPAGLNGVRIIIYGSAFIRYATIYVSKETRFSLMMCVAFMLLVTGFGLNIPQYFSTQVALLTITGAFVRISGYSMLLLAYSVG